MPLLDLFFTMLWFFLFFAWIWVLISIVGDIFRSDDMGGFAKAMWLVFVLLLPLLGVLAYIIARGDGMTRRNIQRASEQEQAARAYIQDAARVSPADELAKLADLRSSGVITEEEFAAQKAKLLG
jgi:ABC-type multidrug transport system fused ATPase/permease subunit